MKRGHPRGAGADDDHVPFVAAGRDRGRLPSRLLHLLGVNLVGVWSLRHGRSILGVRLRPYISRKP